MLFWYGNSFALQFMRNTALPVGGLLWRIISNPYSEKKHRQKLLLDDRNHYRL